MDISVYMPVYNGERFIARCIDSVLSQEFNGDFEFIIVDDGSTDNTVSIIESYNDPRITLYKCEHKGIVGASNFGLEQCRGKYIARIDADDEMTKKSLQKRFDFLENNSDYSFVCGDAYLMRDEMIVQRYGYGFEVTHEELLKHMCVTHSCLMHRASLNIRYLEKWTYAEDYYMLLDITKNGEKGMSLEDAICCYYIHPEQICSKYQKQNTTLSFWVKMHFMNLKYRNKRKKGGE